VPDRMPFCSVVDGLVCCPNIAVPIARVANMPHARDQLLHLGRRRHRSREFPRVAPFVGP